MTTSIPTFTLEKFSTFGDLLRFLRRRAGITQVELSIAVGYSDAQISRLEQNLRLPDIPTIEARFVPALSLESEPKAVARLLELAANVRREDAPAPGLCPYKGLNYFDEADSDLFVGRETLTNQLAERVLSMASNDMADDIRFLAVVGASGSGKSSLVRAGLVPALRWNKKSSDWHIHIITPAAHPLESLAASLTQGTTSVSATATLMDDLSHETRSLHLFAKRKLQREENCRILLVIDQFEELFSLCRLEEERSAFIENLLTAASDADSSVIVVITLRADFYAHCANYIQLREALAHHQEYIGSMTVDELRRAIEEPARRGRWELEPGLVDLLLHDVGSEPGALPLLSHALLETWQRRRERRLTLSGYASSGGVRGAIAETAEMVFTDQFTREQQAIARRVFLRLTELSDESSTGDTRRRATFNELILKPEETLTTRAVLKALADARLITTSENSAEVAHEALIREWPTLRGWLEENREGLRLHRHLTEAAQEWSSMNHETDLLYRGVRLAQAREWANQHNEDMNSLEREFINASIEQNEQEIRKREEQRQRELEAAQKLAQAEQQRAAELDIINSVREGLASKLDFDSIVELVGNKIHEIFHAQCVISIYDPLTRMISVPFYWVEGERISEKPFPLGQGITSVIIESRKSLRLATADEILSYGAVPPQGFDVGKSYLGVPLLAANNEVLGAIAIHDRVREQAFSETDEHLLSTLANSMSVALENARLFHETQRLLKETKQGANQLRARAMYLAGAFIIALIMALTALFFGEQARQSAVVAQQNALLAQQNADVADTNARQAESEKQIATSRELAAAAVNNLSVDPELSILLALQAERVSDTLEAENALHRSILASHLQLTLRGHTAEVWNVVYSPDGKRIATSSQDQTANVWDVATGQLLLTLAGHTAGVYGLDFSPDGRRIVTSSDDNTAKVWDAATGKELFTLIGHESIVRRVKFSPDGKRIATVSRDGTARLWDATTGQQLTMMQYSTPIPVVAFSPDGSWLATGTNTLGSDVDTKLIIWDSFSGEQLRTLSIGESNDVIQGVAFSPDGTRIAAVAQNNIAIIWNANTGQELVRFTGHHNSVASIAFSPDGKWAATGSQDHTAKVWDSTTGDELLTLYGHDRGVNNLTFSPDGSHLATASLDGTARIWDLSPARELLFLPTDDDLGAVSFNPDATRILSVENSDHMAKEWDALSGKLLRTFTGQFDLGSLSVYSRDGKLIATVNGSGPIVVYDIQRSKELISLPGQSDLIESIAFSPDGKELASSGLDGTAIIWGLPSGKPLFTLKAHTGPVNAVSFSPDGKQVVTGSDDNTAIVWDATTGKPVRTLSGHTDIIWGLAYSLDGRRIATVSSDSTARIWDASTGQTLLTLRGHSGAVYLAAFSPDGKLLATGSKDETIKIWDLTTGINVLTLPMKGAPGGIAFSPDGTRLAARSGVGGISVFALPIDDVVALARSRVTRNLTLEECWQYLHANACPVEP